MFLYPMLVTSFEQYQLPNMMVQVGGFAVAVKSLSILLLSMFLYRQFWLTEANHVLRRPVQNTRDQEVDETIVRLQERLSY